MANSSVLNMEPVDLQSNPPHYTKDVETERVLNAVITKSDRWAGLTSGSCFSMFQISGSTSDNLGDAGGLGSEYTRIDRVIQEVVCWAATSGSGGVSRLDIQIQQGPAGNFSSIFTNNAFKPALSSSLGNYGIARGATFVSGSNMVWQKNTLLKASLDTAAGAAGISGQKGLIVQVFWYPSGSW